jgi:hypothetical protein
VPNVLILLLFGVHIMLRDLLTQKCERKKRLLMLDIPEHVESENIKFKIGHLSSAYFIKCG